MASLDKEIKVLMLKGERGYSSYEQAVEEELFSGTLEEWIETFATPENYVTRNEFKKVTQAEYDALKRDGELIPNCYYVITDDDSWEEITTRLTALEETTALHQANLDSLYGNAMLSSNLNNPSIDFEEFVDSDVYYDVGNIVDIALIKGIFRLTVNFGGSEIDLDNEVTFILDTSNPNTVFMVKSHYYLYMFRAIFNNGTLRIHASRLIMSFTNNEFIFNNDGDVSEGTNVLGASFKLTLIKEIKNWN